MSNALSPLEYDLFEKLLFGLTGRIRTADNIEACKAYIVAIQDTMDAIRRFVRKLAPTISLREMLKKEDEMESTTGVESPTRKSLADLFEEIDS